MASAPNAAEIRTRTETATVSGPKVRNVTATGAEFWTANKAITIENASARKTMTCDTNASQKTLADGFRRWPGRTSDRGAVPRQFLRLPLVRRPWIVNAAQDAAIHQVA